MVWIFNAQRSSGVGLMPGWKCYLGCMGPAGKIQRACLHRDTETVPSLFAVQPVSSQAFLFTVHSLSWYAASSQSPSEGAQRPRSLKPWAQTTVSPFKLHISGILSQGWNLTNTGLRRENKADREITGRRIRTHPTEPRQWVTTYTWAHLHLTHATSVPSSTECRSHLSRSHTINYKLYYYLRHLKPVTQIFVKDEIWNEWIIKQTVYSLECWTSNGLIRLLQVKRKSACSKKLNLLQIFKVNVERWFLQFSLDENSLDERAEENQQ